MKKFVVHSVLAILCFSILFALIPGTVAQTNLLSNSGFENSLESWSVTSGTATYTIDSVSHSGASSVKGVETTSGSLGRLIQNIAGLVTAVN